jgi:hypothetical protein
MRYTRPARTPEPTRVAVGERSIDARKSGSHNALRDLRRIAENQVTAFATSSTKPAATEMGTAEPRTNDLSRARLSPAR